MKYFAGIDLGGTFIKCGILDENGGMLVKDKTATPQGYFPVVERIAEFVRGLEKKVDFVPKDMGGYEPLDILFDIAPKAELIMRDEVMANADGSKTQYTTYTAQVTDEDGEIWDCSVKPQRDSDKALLRFMLICLHKKTTPAA